MMDLAMLFEAYAAVDSEAPLSRRERCNVITDRGTMQPSNVVVPGCSCAKAAVHVDIVIILCHLCRRTEAPLLDSALYLHHLLVFDLCNHQSAEHGNILMQVRDLQYHAVSSRSMLEAMRLQICCQIGRRGRWGYAPAHALDLPCLEMVDSTTTAPIDICPVSVRKMCL